MAITLAQFRALRKPQNDLGRTCGEPLQGVAGFIYDLGDGGIPLCIETYASGHVLTIGNTQRKGSLTSLERALYVFARRENLI